MDHSNKGSYNTAPKDERRLQGGTERSSCAQLLDHSLYEESIRVSDSVSSEENEQVLELDHVPDVTKPVTSLHKGKAPNRRTFQFEFGKRTRF